MNNEYIIKPGDSLWKISKQNNIPLTKLRQLNPQIKGDLIKVGQVLNLKPKLLQKFIDLREERTNENELNKDNLSAIQSIPHNSNYVVVDKKNSTLNVFNSNNDLIYSTKDISTGASQNDYNTITYVDSKGVIRNKAGNNSTPAGITTITGVGTYHGYPSFIRSRTNSDGSIEDIASSFHWGNTSNAKNSNGCVRIGGNALNILKNLIGEGTQVYTLPEQDGSKFSVKNGKLNFTADNPYGETKGSKKYWDDYNINIDKSYSPLIIYYNGNNTDPKYNGNVLKFVNSIANNKQFLQKKFGLSSDEYNRLSELAVGIAQQESKYGTSDRYKLKQFIPDAFIALAKFDSNAARSRGLTQIKINGDNQELRNIYKELRINEDSIKNPEVSAIATIARLAYMYNTEIKGRKFKGVNNANINPYDALLYKYMGRNSELKNNTATPEINNYISNVKRYALDFEFIEPRMVEQYKKGNKLELLKSLRQ